MKSIKIRNELQDLSYIKQEEKRIREAKRVIAKIKPPLSSLIYEELEYLVVSDKSLAIKNLAFKKLRQGNYLKEDLKEYFLKHYLNTLKRIVVIEYGKKLSQNASFLSEIDGKKTIIIFPDYVYEKIKRVGIAIACEVILTPRLKKRKKDPIAFFRKRFFPERNLCSLPFVSKYEILGINMDEEMRVRKKNYCFSKKYSVKAKIPNYPRDYARVYARPLVKGRDFSTLLKIEGRFYLC